MTARQLVFREDARDRILRGAAAAGQGKPEFQGLPMLRREQTRHRAQLPHDGGRRAGAFPQSRSVVIGPGRLRGHLLLAPRMTGLVLVASHGGSHTDDGWFSCMCMHFQQHRLGTLQVELLPDPEAGDAGTPVDVALLSARIGEVLRWIAEQLPVTGRCCGLFGSSAVAAAMLQAAATTPARVGAVVVRGCRLDLAWPSLPSVLAPTLLIASGDSPQEVELNSAGLRALRCRKRLEVVPGATHPAPESGVRETLAELSAQWMDTYLREERPA